MKSLYETLAVLGAGAVLLTGCGGAPAPVNAAEVPAATESKPSDPKAAPTEGKTGDSAAGATMEGAKPADAAAPAAAPAAATSAKPAAGPVPVKKTGKKTDAKKTGANGGCGEGTCG
jgi:uncharacterized low-complexity protein